MPKDISKNPDAYNRPFIVRDAIVHYSKEGEVTISADQEILLKDNFPTKEVPVHIKYKKEEKEKEVKIK